MFTAYENLLPSNLFENLHSSLCTREKWKFDLLSGPRGTIVYQGESDITFWSLSLNDDELFTKTLFEKICQVTGKKFEILRVYANGQTYGLCGDIHQDSPYKDEYTFLYYVNPIWNVKWGGATLFCEMKDPIQNKLKHFQYKGDTLHNNVMSYYPKPNTGVLYQSAVAHMGTEPTRHFKDLRITVSYKLKLLK